MRKLPSKAEILARAEELAMERQVIGMGVEPITPTEKELKESGVFREARLQLMRAGETPWRSEQRRYIEDMASEMGLKLMSKKEYKALQKLMMKPKNHKFIKQKRKPSPALLKEARKVVKAARKPKKKRRKRKVKKKEEVKPQRPTFKQLMKGTVLTGYVEARRVRQFPKPVKASVADMIMPKRKRRKRHVERVGKTMRKLRKIDGVKVFSFPDHIWKVKKPKKNKRKGKKKRRRK